MDQTYLEKIKRLGIIAMFSDDDLMDQLVLKGGNVLDIVYKISTRPSADLDFSIDGDFADSRDAELRIKRALEKTFAAEGLLAFDFRFRPVPPNLSADRADFWGGYKAEFKLVELKKAQSLGNDLEKMRRAALTIGKAKTGAIPSTRFGIDLSKYEYCDDKDTIVLDGYNVFVYSPQMFVSEKIRALCQQMPSYTAFVGSNPSGRARDFLDIFIATTHFELEFSNEDFQRLIPKVFAQKRVPLSLIGEISEQRDFHRDSFQVVQITVRPDADLKDYDFYFDFVVERCQALEPLWNE